MPPRLKTAACLLLLLASTIAFFWKIAFTNEYTLLAQHDNAVQAYPWLQFAARAVHRGDFPVWDPYTWSGHSFIGEMQPGLFYPLNLLLFCFPLDEHGVLPATTIEAFLILEHFLAACFMFFLARRLGISRYGAVAAGLTFALSGFLGRMSVGILGLFHSAIWLPLVVHLYLNAAEDERLSGRACYAMLAGLFLGVSILGGHHNAPLFILVVLAVLSLFLIFSKDKQSTRKQRASRLATAFLISVVAAFAFSAIQLLPTAEFSGRALRWAEAEIRPGQTIPFEIHARNSFQPRDWVALLLPNLYFSREINVYLGILPLLLAIYALVHFRNSRPIRFCALLMSLALLYSLGRFSFLYGLLYALAPFVEKAREPVRGLYLVHFSMALLAGFGADLAFGPMRPRAKDAFRKFLRAAGWAAVFVLAVVFSGFVVKEWVLKNAEPADSYPATAAFLLAVCVGLLYARRYRGIPRSWLRPLAILLLLFDFSVFNTWGFLPKSGFDGKGNFDPEQYYRPNEMLRFLTSQPDYFRVDIRDGSLPPAVGDVHGLQTVLGYGAAVYLDYWDFLWSDYAALGRPLDLLNVRYIVSRQELGGLKAVEGGEIKLYERPHALPRAWIVHKVETIEDNKAQIRRINEPSFDPRNSAVTNAALEIALPGNAASPLDQALITSYEPNIIALEAATTGPGLLVLSEVNYPGWEAFVDGKPTRIYRADGILRAVALSGGHHNVVFRYRPRSVLIGLWLLVVGSVSLIGVAVWHLQAARGRTPCAPTSQ